MRKQELIKYLIVFKIMVIGAMFAQYQGWFYVGDRQLRAANGEAVEGASAPKPDSSPATPPAETAKSKRKSFLEGLLDLPAMETDKVKKDELGKYLGLLEDRRAMVEERIRILANREKDLQSLEKSVEGKIAKLEEERRFFGETLQREKDLKGERLDKLVTLYAKMEPKKAAPVFEKMDKDLAVALFKELKQKQITLILENMKAETAVQLSEYYGRVRSTREYEVLKEMNSSLRSEFQNCRGMPEGAREVSSAAPPKPTQSSPPASPGPGREASSPSNAGANGDDSTLSH